MFNEMSGGMSPGHHLLLLRAAQAERLKIREAKQRKEFEDSEKTTAEVESDPKQSTSQPTKE